MKISTRWFKGLKEEQDKKELKANLLNSREVLNALVRIIEEDLETSVKEARKEDNYELPSWSHYQADKLGEQRAYQKIINFIKE